MIEGVTSNGRVMHSVVLVTSYHCRGIIHVFVFVCLFVCFSREREREKEGRFHLTENELIDVTLNEIDAAVTGSLTSDVTSHVTGVNRRQLEAGLTPIFH